MHHNTYQPPANFPQGPHSKYPQLPPMNSGQVGVNLENAHQKLLLKNELQVKEADMGSWGILCRIWFLLVIIFCLFPIYFDVVLMLLDYLQRNIVQPKYALFLFLCVWLVVQSFLTILNVGSKDAVRAKKLWISMICFAVMYFFFGVLAVDSQFVINARVIILLYVLPVGGSLVLTGVLKNNLEKREELVKKLEVLSSVINP